MRKTLRQTMKGIGICSLVFFSAHCTQPFLGGGEGDGGENSMLAVAALIGATPKYELVWSDEFDGTSLDETKWEYMIGDGTDIGLPAGWGNNELQYYRPENATVANGYLTIEGRAESFNGYNYTSSRLRTMGKADFKYGRIEARIDLPTGQGVWPAFWMLPTDFVYGGWAASGEIDIMEAVCHDTYTVHGTLHYGGAWPDNVYSGKGYRNGTDFAQDFHVYTIEWEPGEIRWYVDGDHYQTQIFWYSSPTEPYPAPFDQKFHILLNMAIGGNWPGSPDASTVFPQQMIVDYVRVYQKPTN